MYQASALTTPVAWWAPVTRSRPTSVTGRVIRAAGSSLADGILRKGCLPGILGRRSWRSAGVAGVVLGAANDVNKGPCGRVGEWGKPAGGDGASGPGDGGQSSQVRHVQSGLVGGLGRSSNVRHTHDPVDAGIHGVRVGGRPGYGIGDLPGC